MQGGNIQYPGHFLAAEGLVVVVPNYRLETFGKRKNLTCLPCEGDNDDV